MSQAPPSVPAAQGMRPHRGVLILVFSILSWVLGCFIFGIVAWVMGNADLREMAAGRMDPSGQGLTQAGKIVGMINVIVSIVSIVIVILMMVLGVGLFAAAAAHGTAPGGTPVGP